MSELSLEERVMSLESSHSELKSAIAKNTELTEDIKKNTGDIIAFFNSVRVGVGVIYTFGKFIRWLGKLALSLIAILSIVAGLAYYLKNGHLPPTLNLDLDP